MTDDKEMERTQESVESAKLRKTTGARRTQICQTCGSTPEITRSMLSIYTGKTVRLYECKCGERIWDD